MMTKHHERSREEWEQELIDRQHNVTPAERLRASYYASGDLANKRPAIVSILRFVFGLVIAALGIVAFREAESVAIAVSLLAVGGCIALTAVRWTVRRDKN